MKKHFNNNSAYEKLDYKNSEFLGPLFIIGMPRSGTKLLRELLNNHPLISIPEIETNFLQVWGKNWQKYGDLSNPANFKKFYEKSLVLPYFMYMKENKKLIKCKDWYHLCQNYTVQNVFETLIRHDANVKYESQKIWGDKSPKYRRYICLLNELFPEARFIHIIRDVRDYCLSIKKAWGKNMFRAAQRWCNDVSKVQKDIKKFPEKYLEIKYENLITDPDKILKQVCNFLNVEYNPKMQKILKSVENLGDAKEIKEIKSDNKMKYEKYMDSETKNKIEAIAANVLKSNCYNVQYSGNIKTLTSNEMVFYQIIDGINRISFNIKERGLKRGLYWSINLILSKLRT